MNWNWKRLSYAANEEWKRLDWLVVKLDDQGRRVEIPKFTAKQKSVSE